MERTREKRTPPPKRPCRSELRHPVRWDDEACPRLCLTVNDLSRPVTGRVRPCEADDASRCLELRGKGALQLTRAQARAAEGVTPKPLASRTTQPAMSARGPPVMSMPSGP